MKNGTNVTIKDQRGDTIKDFIYRYSLKEQAMIDTYDKYENRMLIKQIFTEEMPFR